MLAVPEFSLQLLPHIGKSAHDMGQMHRPSAPAVLFALGKDKVEEVHGSFTCFAA
jgi:hypothetical protein